MDRHSNRGQRLLVPYCRAGFLCSYWRAYPGSGVTSFWFVDWEKEAPRLTRQISKALINIPPQCLYWRLAPINILHASPHSLRSQVLLPSSYQTLGPSFLLDFPGTKKWLRLRKRTTPVSGWTSMSECYSHSLLWSDRTFSCSPTSLLAH